MIVHIQYGVNLLQYFALLTALKRKEPQVR